MRNRGLGAMIAMAMLSIPPDGVAPEHRDFRPRMPRSKRNGMRRATVRLWNEREKSRRVRQIAQGIIGSGFGTMADSTLWRFL